MFTYHENPNGPITFTSSGDAWKSIDNKIAAVADAPLRALTRHKRDFLNQDYSAQAAQLFCQNVTELAEQIILTTGKFDEQSMRDVLLKTNQEIKQFNHKLGKSYTDGNNYDVAETVAAAYVIHDGWLYYGLVEDCYLNVLRGNDLQDQIKLDYQIMRASKYLDQISAQGKLEDYLTPELKSILPQSEYWEPTWCRFLRNNNDINNETGEKLGWGCFNGEDKIADFFQIGKVQLQPGDHILLFTDGMIPVLDNVELKQKIVKLGNQIDFNKSLQLRQSIMDTFKDTKENWKEKTLLYQQYQY